ncbi:hypothetical protein BDW42DRAFT_119593 [Aspergillus taichungensis]|uniref:Uncharacterized protein n=1 Tax=Aspergillus taichungensis TaxID=482145 RepID=A0A2J5HRF5_9EURO|nr:hypothetical protein BDW42DRAFT_119593 [Aspergillus taichungensis]
MIRKKGQKKVIISPRLFFSFLLLYNVIYTSDIIGGSRGIVWRFHCQSLYCCPCTADVPVWRDDQPLQWFLGEQSCLYISLTFWSSLA